MCLQNTVVAFILLLSKCPKYSALINVYTFQFQRNALYRLKNKKRETAEIKTEQQLQYTIHFLEESFD